MAVIEQNLIRDIIQLRAGCKDRIRRYFAEQNVLEVDTPLLANFSVTDPYMSSLKAVNFNESMHGYLQTSPEYAMKKLLCNGSGDIFQLDKAFRADENGRHHRTEFTMLEWYRLGWNEQKLMDEVFHLIELVCGSCERVNLSYRDVFIDYLGIDPFTIQEKELADFTINKLGDLPENMLFDNFLTLLFATQIEPQFDSDRVTFVYDFPASQAALARTQKETYGHVGKRFEAYFGGLELANGFYELTDADAQLRRFINENNIRSSLGYPEVDIDYQLIDAMKKGLPNCAGVALGFDRLLMVKIGASDIQQVLPLENLAT